MSLALAAASVLFSSSLAAYLFFCAAVERGKRIRDRRTMRQAADFIRNNIDRPELIRHALDGVPFLKVQK